MNETIDQIAAERLSPTPSEPSSTVQPLTASVAWIPEGATPAAARTMFATPAILNEKLYRADRILIAHQYPRQRNYHGLYHFSQTGLHVWHESLLEASTLRWLDLHENIAAIASQPCRIAFSDGTVHTPDYLSLHRDGRQVLYDVKPTKFLVGAQAQFDKTRVICERIGWGYVVHSELPRQVQVNTEWVSHFRHHRFHPGPVATERLLGQLTASTTIREAAERIGLTSLAHGRSAVYHLVAIRVLSIDLDTLVSDRSLVRKNSNAHA